jgi:putative resolvase
MEKSIAKEHTVEYRVSSSQNNKNLESQNKRLCRFCRAKGWTVDESIEEIGSGLNDKRPILLKILSKRKATRIAVEHKDRLARFGLTYIQELCKSFIVKL